MAADKVEAGGSVPRERPAGEHESLYVYGRVPCIADTSTSFGRMAPI